MIIQAFVYVGLYGYSYLEAGKNVITLFKNRGWEAIIADDLISNGKYVVFCMSFFTLKSTHELTPSHF